MALKKLYDKELGYLKEVRNPLGKKGHAFMGEGEKGWMAWQKIRKYPGFKRISKPVKTPEKRAIALAKAGYKSVRILD